MSYALWIPDVLSDAGLRVEVVPGWETRGSFDFDGEQPEGVCRHHTASARTWGSRPALGICTHGRGGAYPLPGPLCNILTPRDEDPADVIVVAAGRANHAGYGGPWKTVPLNSGNKYLIGNEVENDGVGELWTPRLLEVCTIAEGAILDHCGHGSDRELGHKEWAPTRKIDPNVPSDMDDARARIAEWQAKGGVLLEPHGIGLTAVEM